MRLNDTVQETQPRHRFMSKFGVDPNHLRVLQRLNEVQHVSRCRKVEVSARFIRFRFQCKTELVALFLDIMGEKVYRLTKPLDCVRAMLRRINLCAFTSAPEDINGCPQLDAEVNSVHRFLDGEGADFGMV